MCGLVDANSTEFSKNGPHPVIDLMPDQKKVKGKGASMRLGTWDCHIQPGTKALQVYGKQEIRERQEKIDQKVDESIRDSKFPVTE